MVFIGKERKVVRNLREIASRLGISERMDEEVQVLAHGFKTVDLEGLASFDNVLPQFNSETDRNIKTNWAAKVAKNPSMFPGSLASVKDFAVMSNVLNLRLQRSRFDFYDSLKQKMPLQLNLAEKPLDRGLCLPLSMGAVTITAPDTRNPTGTIIFGIRSISTSFGAGNSTTLPSGYFNPDTDRLQIGDPPSIGSLISIRLTTLKELKEEMNVRDYRQFEYLGLIYDGVMSKGALVAIRLRLDLTAKELKWSMKDTGREVKQYHFIPDDLEAVKDFIEKYPPTPHDIARLVLHFAAN